MAPPALGPEIYGLGFRFNPTPQEAVTYYLPRLVSGDPRALHEAVRPVIHHAEVYACDPADLARRFRPMPRTHNRFFFTVIKKGVRAAGPGSWSGQSTAEIKDKQGVQIGELRKFRYKKRGVLTDWLMEEYSSCGLDGAGDGGMQFALCKVYVSPKAAPNSDAYKESAACFATPPPAAPAVITQPAAAKRPAPPQDVTPPCAKRMRVPAVQPAPPPQPPAPPAPTLSSLTAVRKMQFAPPQPSAPRCGSTPQPSSALAPPPAPPAPTRSHLASIRRMSFAPPQPCVPRRGLPADSVTRPSPAPIQAPALPVPIRPAVEARRLPLPMPAPPRPLAQPKEQVPLPTPQVIRASLPKQRRILDPFEASMLRDEAEEQTVTAAPHLPESPAAAPVLQDDDDDDDLVKALEDAMSAAEAKEQTVAAALQDEDEDEDGWDELDKEIEDAMRAAEADEETVTAAPARLQDDDDDFAKVIEDMLSAEAEQPTVAALEFDVDAFFNFSEETRLRVCLPQADHAIKV